MQIFFILKLHFYAEVKEAAKDDNKKKNKEEKKVSCA